METLNNIPCVSDETKEACAIETMRYMLQQYAQDHQLTFEDAFFAFSTSSTYLVLFDFETEVWKEGPDYLRCYLKKHLSRKLCNLFVIVQNPPVSVTVADTGGLHLSGALLFKKKLSVTTNNM